MVEEGLNILVVGMTTVFAFLALLVLLMYASGRIFEALGTDAAVASASIDDGSDADIAIVIAAAEAHRRQITEDKGDS